MRRLPLLAVLLLAALAAPGPAHGAARVAVVGGMPTPIEAAPWQVQLQIGGGLNCGGSILGPTSVLTAAHCVMPAGEAVPRPAGSIIVHAGFDEVRRWRRPAAPPPGAQSVGVATVRVHPLFNPITKADDVALLTLAQPLDLSTPRARPIGLAPAGAPPPPGTALAFTGYGTQEQSRPADGRLYGGTLVAIDDDQCRENLPTNASASVLCVARGGQAPCFGDSGGPLVLGALQVGVASYAPVRGCGQGPTGFADVTAPEVRAFLDGTAQIPVGPRQRRPTVLRSVLPPVVASPMNCAPGGWEGAPAFRYAFVDERTGVVLQSGRRASFTPRAAQRGATVACVVRAANAGGVASARSAASLPVDADAVAPWAVLSSVRCRGRRCTVWVTAADPNSRGRLDVRVAIGGRRVRAERYGARAYTATARKLRRGRARVRVRVTDAAGNTTRKRFARSVRVR